MKKVTRVSKVLCDWMIVISMGFALFTAPLAFGQTAAGANPAESTFKANCALCHGPDGAGSALGKRLQVPDLRSKDVQGQSDEALTKVITNGKEKMPAFGARLSSDQIQKLVDYLRHLPGAAQGSK
jgi:cytochrome c6